MLLCDCLIFWWRHSQHTPLEGLPVSTVNLETGQMFGFTIKRGKRRHKRKSKRK